MQEGALKREDRRVQLAVFRAGAGEYAVDIMRITEIIRPQKLTLIPKAPDFIEGVINLRGSVVPVIDIRKRLGITHSGEETKSKILILLIDGRKVGAVVDDVKEILYMDMGLIEDAPEIVKGSEAQFLQGIGKFGERLIMVLDPEKLLNPGELAELDRARTDPEIKG